MSDGISRSVLIIHCHMYAEMSTGRIYFHLGQPVANDQSQMLMWQVTFILSVSKNLQTKSVHLTTTESCKCAGTMEDGTLGVGRH